MLSFTKIDEKIIKLKDFFDKSPLSFCDYSIGTRYMWQKDFPCEYTLFNNTLIMKNCTKEYNDFFFYPIGENPLEAIKKIEEYSLKNGFLGFCCVNNKILDELTKKYPIYTVITDRAWSDYIYNLEDLAFFKGKKYSGQRNHINKFNRLYSYEFSKLTKEDIPKVKNFLEEYAQNNRIDDEKIAETNNTLKYLDHLFGLHQEGAILKVNDKIIGFTAGEVVNDTLIIHVEKALTNYEGVYPLLVSEFAKTFLGKATFINREEDCGDLGLRTSKLQYKPIELREKFIVKIDTAFSRIPTNPTIKTDRLLLTPLKEENKQDYFALYTDDDLNKYWGYDYREDLGDKEPTADYFYNFAKMLKETKQEFSFAVNLNDKMIGEGILWNFDFEENVELGLRLFRNYHGLGYGVETYSALKNYAKNTINANKVKAKCMKQNLPSKNMILKAGFTLIGEDDIYYYFEA